LAKEVDIVQDSLELASLQASMKYIHFATRSGDAQVNETSSAMKLFQNAYILSAVSEEESSRYLEAVAW
jgi:hypothetical protein